MTTQGSQNAAGNPIDEPTPMRSIRLPGPVVPVHRGRRKLPLSRRSKVAGHFLAAFLIAIVVRLVGLGIALIDPMAERASGFGVAGEDRQPTSPGRRGVPAPEAGVDPVEIVGMVAGWSVLALALAAGVASVYWLHRAWGNWSTQGKPRHDESWVVLAWLVPPLNLWRPAEIVIDMLADRPGMRNIDTSSSWLIALWWVPGVLGVAGTILLLLRGDWFPPTDARHHVIMAHVLLAISATSGRRLISELTSRHDARS